MAKVLVVEDDIHLAETVRAALEFEHHTVEMSHTGPDALSRLAVSDYDLMILDLGLPGVNGIDICKHVRSQRRTMPIIMLTGQREIQQKEVGFESGADDYVTKPFDFRELAMRVRAALRRGGAQVSQALQVRNIMLDPLKHLVTKDGKEVRLRPTDFALLEFLMRHPDLTYTNDQLLASVWTSESDATVEAVRTCIKRLRKELDDDGAPSMIETVHGLGYKLRSQ